MFKDQILIDARQTFLNPAEFSDAHKIDGRTVICQVDKDAFQKKTGGIIEGVFVHGVVIYANTDDFLNVPVIGQRLRVDHDFYYVDSVNEEYGVLIITARANES